jgi:hypothetical protein
METAPGAAHADRFAQLCPLGPEKKCSSRSLNHRLELGMHAEGIEGRVILDPLLISKAMLHGFVQKRNRFLGFAGGCVGARHVV